MYNTNVQVWDKRFTLKQSYMYNTNVQVWDKLFNKYIINVTTTEINTCKKIFEFGQREVISFFTLVTNKGEHSIIYSK